MIIEDMKEVEVIVGIYKSGLMPSPPFIRHSRYFCYLPLSCGTVTSVVKL